MLIYNEKPILKMKNIKKKFSGIYALSGISFDLYASEIHCLVGENGAGKSTLMKVLSGAYTPSEGEINISDKTYSTLNPHISKNLGINIVYQENDLVPSMNVVENIYVGSEISDNFGLIKFDEMFKLAKKMADELELKIDLLKKVEDLSVSDRQFVKILKALSTEPRILILDEPTSMFNVEDATKVLELVKRIASKGIGIVYISHYLEEIRKIADRITVIRDGLVVNTYTNKDRDIDLSLITRDMVGRPLDTFYKKEYCEIGDVILEVKDLQLKENSPKINFNVRKGEILGFAGMVGAGRTEILRAITGADYKYAGKIYINGKEVSIRNPREGIKHGFAHITEDRQGLGLMLGISVLENTIIVGLENKIKGLFISLKAQVPSALKFINKLNCKMPSIWTDAIYLSGGNQQKLVLAKWLFVEQEIYIFDEPTRGIDVGSKAEFYSEMTELTKRGKSIIMISSDMTELISMSDRVLVIRNGAIDSELLGASINEQEIIKRALGVNKYER